MKKHIIKEDQPLTEGEVVMFWIAIVAFIFGFLLVVWSYQS